MAAAASATVRLHRLFGSIAWCCALNAMWIAFTLLGGVVLGIGPATVAACVLCRRRMRGESIQLRDFATTWWREFARGTAVVLPMAIVTLALLSNYAFFSTLGPGASAARLVTLVTLVLAIGAASYVAPMYAHYDLPLRSYALKATRFALTHPASTIILLFVFAVFAVASAVMPVLLAIVSFGAWWQASTWLCLRFFQENEDRLALPEAQPRVLPVEPLRLR